jgi:hypothetical protein
VRAKWIGWHWAFRELAILELGLPTVNKKPKQHSHTHDADNPSRPIHDFIELRAWFSPVSHKRFLAMDNEGAWQPPHYPFDSCADDV